MNKRKFGLLGKHIDYSFSRAYFKDKFEKLGLKDSTYVNFDFPELNQDVLGEILQKDLVGFNITIPYKTEIIPYLDHLDQTAKSIGAVNTVCCKNGELIGYNTDVLGFKNRLEELQTRPIQHALILGTGGASKAVAYALDLLGVSYRFVSRNASEDNQISYQQLSKMNLEHMDLVVNTTPVGTFPEVDSAPDFPYGKIHKDMLFYDLIYNPEKTQFLKRAEENGARIENGYQMLVGQAEAAYQLWNNLD
jgi:shikimate dehydrogenase